MTRLARQRWLVLASLCCTVAALAAEPGPISALELAELAPAALAAELADIRPAYRGQSPDELLTLLTMLQPMGAAADDGLAATARRQCSDLLCDMLYEWPSPAQAAAIRSRLDSHEAAQQWPALLAAAGAVDDDEVRASLLQLAEGERIAVAVAAVLSLGASPDPAARALFDRLATNANAAVREAAATARRHSLALTGEQVIPAIDAAATLRTTHGRLLRHATAPAAAEGAAPEVVVLRWDKSHPGTFTPESLAITTRALQAGGTVLVCCPDGTPWPEAANDWAQTNGIELPGGAVAQHVMRGVVSYADYRAFADYPFELRDQPGAAASWAWRHWGAGSAAPIRTADGQAALAVVHEGAADIGRVVFTTVDLEMRPIYRENLLRWLYGDVLLAVDLALASEYEFHTGGETPHWPWAKPLAARPKVLYLTSSLFKQGLLEVQQRLDGEWRYVPYDATFAVRSDKDLTTPSRMGQRAVALLDNALHWAEVVVFDVGTRNLLRSLTREQLGYVSLDTVPSRLRRRIYRRVHDVGMGLVGVGSPRATEICARDFAVRANGAPVPTQLIIPFAKAHTEGAYAGNGVVAAVAGNGRLCWFGQRLPHSSDEGERIPELALAAADAVPGLLQPQFPVPAEEYWYAMLVRQIRWSAGAAPAVTISGMELRDGQLTVDLTTPVEGTVDCHFRNAYNDFPPTIIVPVSGARAQAAVELPAGWYVLRAQLRDTAGRVIDFAARRVSVSAPVSVVGLTAEPSFCRVGETARLTATLSAPWSGAARYLATDTYGRRVAAGELPVDPTSEQLVFAVAVDHPRSRLWDIEVQLLQDERVIAFRRQPIGIVLPPRDLDFEVTASIYRDSLIPFFKDRMGVDVSYGAVDSRLRHNLELSGSNWSEQIGASPTPGARLTARERQPCLSSPAFRLQATRDFQARGPLLHDLGITDYQIDDECSPGGRCFSAACLFRFREFLKADYADLAALNQAWGTAFASWREVMPLQGTDPKRPGSYVDFINFTTWKFAEYASFLEMLGNDYVPGFKAGHSGGVSGNLMMDLAGALFYYGVSEAAVSAKQPGAIIGSWFRPGYRFVEQHEVESRSWPWQHLFRGTTRIQLWYPKTGPPAYHTDLSRPFQAFVWLHEEMQDIRSGLGKLLLHCDRDEGQVAIYNSQRSGMVNAALREIDAGQADAGVTMKTKLHWQQAFLSRQIECRFVSEQQVEQGELQRRKPKLLLLPGVVSLSTLERQALTAYVAGGGMIGIDESLGLRDAHGTWTGSGFMATLAAAGACLRVDFDTVQAAPLVAEAGLGPLVGLGIEGPVVFGNFRDQQALYAGFVSDTYRDITISLPAAQHLYDARRGRYLGVAQTYQAQLLPGVAQVYASLPYELTGLTVDVRTATPRPGTVLEVRASANTDGPAPGKQVWRVTVSNALGRPIAAHSCRLPVRGGEATIVVPLALNAAPGTWRIDIRDAATGVVGSADFEVLK